jgi:uncharacterized protein YndB with AHSA1/START domain
MDKSGGTKRTAMMSDDAVKAKTGKTWAEWFKILDAAGAKKLDHKGIVAILSGQHGLGSWWRQMVTVGYERERGLRVVHQNARGFSASASKTIAVPVMKLFDAWNDEKIRRRWLPKSDFEIRKATPGKSMRITWIEGKTNVDVGFFSKGKDKSQVAVQHDKLADAKAVARMKKFWSKALLTLQETLAG